MYEHAPIEKSMGLDDSASRSLTGKRAQAPELFGVKGNHNTGRPVFCRATFNAMHNSNVENPDGGLSQDLI